MSCRRCRYQHGVVDGLCSDCSRWTNQFTPEELAALACALGGMVLMGLDEHPMEKLRLEVLAARTDTNRVPGLIAAREHAERVSETADSRP